MDTQKNRLAVIDESPHVARILVVSARLHVRTSEHRDSGLLAVPVDEPPSLINLPLLGPLARHGSSEHDSAAAIDLLQNQSVSLVLHAAIPGPGPKLERISAVYIRKKRQLLPGGNLDRREVHPDLDVGQVAVTDALADKKLFQRIFFGTGVEGMFL